MISSIGFIKSREAYGKLVIHDSELARVSGLACGSGNTASVWSYKVCPTRHGCSGATNCDNAYGDYHR